MTDMTPFLTLYLCIKAEPHSGPREATITTAAEKYVMIAPNREEAEEMTRRAGRERWPPSEGWEERNIDVSPVTLDQAISIVECFPELREGGEAKELVM